MADTTILGLPRAEGGPSQGDILPFSTRQGVTQGTPVSGIFNPDQNYSYNFTNSRASNLSGTVRIGGALNNSGVGLLIDGKTRRSEETNVSLFQIDAGIAGGNQLCFKVNTSGNVGIKTAEPNTALDVNGLTTLRNGLILSSAFNSTWGQGFITSDFGDLKSPGAVSNSVARYFGRATNTGTVYNYNHIILPFDYNGGIAAPFYSRMFCLEVRGYEYANSRPLNFQFVGYSTPASNGGPLYNTNAIDYTGVRTNGTNDLGIYFSTTRNRVICRFGLNNYFASYVVNSIAVGNGRIINPGEIEIVENNSVTI